MTLSMSIQTVIIEDSKYVHDVFQSNLIECAKMHTCVSDEQVRK